MQNIWWYAFIFIGVLVGCSSPTYLDYLEEGEELSGGQTTIFDVSPNAFSQPAPGLEREQELLFFVGNSFFNQNWVTAPASTTARDGLGPLFNARSCASCHFKDGRGRPPDFFGERPTGLLLRLSVRGADGSMGAEPTYGGQLQDGGLEGVEPEGQIHITYEEITGTFADGTPYSLQKPIYTVDQLAYGAMLDDVLISPRVGNQMIGLGLLEAIPAEAILALTDPDDVNGDGVSGRPNWIGEEIGRFGWKANQPTLLHQTVDAFIGDLGITTYLHPDELCDSVANCAEIANGGTPEIDDDDLQKVVLYASSLAVPARRDWDDPTVLRGKELFMQANCQSCHVPKWQTGKHPTIPALSNQTIYPYTDLLLHDMGTGLADGRPDFEATGQEWRTPPLWGIGLIETVNGHTRFLHDGRAHNLTEAILWHGGEAADSQAQFVAMSAADRAALIRFLESQ